MRRFHWSVPDERRRLAAHARNHLSDVRGRLIWAASVTVVLLVAAVMLLTHWAAARAGRSVTSRDHVGNTAVSSAAGYTRGQVPCSAPLVTLTSPVRGAVLRPGSVLLAGRTVEGGVLVDWTVSDAGGRIVSSGLTSGVGSTGPTDFSELLPLEEGTYTLSVRLAGHGGRTDDCDRATATVAVSDAAHGVTWESGASGEGTTNGQFAAWRGTPLPMAGTWADSDGADVQLWQLQAGGEYAHWSGDLDIAVGGLRQGETWAAAARGAYETRWATSLRTMARLWSRHPGTLYIRFAHEFNGSWYSWGVKTGEQADFIAAWKRFRALQQQYFPSSRLVFAPNSETPNDLRLDWRSFFPGREYVDVMSVSYFNAYINYAATPTAFWQNALAVDAFDAPIGIERHREFAGSVGLPFAVSEWGAHASWGDSAGYMEGMYQFFRENAGTEPGEVRYEVLYNVPGENDEFILMPTTRSPAGADAYQRLW